MMTAVHFAEYTEELREFSASHGVRYGAPEDLGALVVALGSCEVFAEECASMLRSVVYRERGEADAVSLLMLSTHAWGGMTEPEEGTALAKPISQLWEFVRGAMRAPQIGEAEPVRENFVIAAVCPEIAAEDGAAMGQRTLFEVESAMRELEAGSAEVRLYCELLQQRNAKLEEWREAEAVPVEVGVAAVAAGGEGGSGVQAAFAREDDPWDENSELQQELRRFAAHRERVLAREAEKAARPLHAKLLGGAESVLGHWLGGGRAERRGLGVWSH